MKKSLFALALCAAVAWFYFTPFMAVDRLQAAAERGDSEALNEMVDFAALRGSMKSEIQGAVAEGISRDPGSPFAAIGSAVTGVIVEPVVNAAVTPQGISLMLKGRRPGDGDDSGDDRNWRERTRIDRHWEASDKFVVQYRDRESGDEQIALLMRRDGLRWRLAGVRFGEK